MFEFKTHTTLVLDVGNVLVSFDLSPVFEVLEKYEYSDSRTKSIIFFKDIENICNLGILNLYSALDLFLKHKSVNDSEKYIEFKNDLLRTWNSEKCIKPNNKIIEFCSSLLEHKSVNIIIASNMGFDHHYYISNTNDFFKHKKLINAYSYKMGAMKPQEIYYHLIKNKLNQIMPSSINHKYMYIDDNIENLHASKEVIPNINTYYFNSWSSTEDDFILNVNNLLHKG